MVTVYREEQTLIEGRNIDIQNMLNVEKITQQFDNNMNLIKEFNSLTEASKSTGIAIQNISASCLGKTKESGGFIWRYKT